MWGIWSKFAVASDFYEAMAKGILKIAALFAVLLVIFALQRVAFVCCNLADVGGRELADYLGALCAGQPLDVAVASYLVTVPLLLQIVAVWHAGRWMWPTERVYYALISTVIALTAVLDSVLYGYWGFRLDMTPLFYFVSSPSAAMASATTAQLIFGPVLIAAVAVGLTAALWRISALKAFAQPALTTRQRSAATALLTVCGALLFVGIRGGVTVSTMNLSRAYFSEDRVLNHIAINPQFSLLYSASHQNDFGNQFQYLPAEEAAAEFNLLTDKHFAPTDSLLACPTPDIYLIIAESFSTHLLPIFGGEPVALRLDSLANEGLTFTNFYANSFRTDRALPAILSGFPSQPTVSVMKYVEKAEHLPSIALSLHTKGYESRYYYGGDINFTNMLAFVKNQGFTTVVCDGDFPLEQRLSKWGVHDHVLMERVAGELSDDTSAPRFWVIQTSSSHEPFEVPFYKSFYPDEPERQLRANAFAYADSCIGTFVRRLQASPRWQRSVVVIVPDHYGAYPTITDVEQRHRIPLIIVGGALRTAPQRISTYGSQIDIAASLLAMVGVDYQAFTFSKNLFDAQAPHFAFFTEPEYMGFATDSTAVIYNLDADRVEASRGNSSHALQQAKAYLQTIYTTLSQL